MQTFHKPKSLQSQDIPIIVGGISNVNNVKALHDQKHIGISGVIIGKAIYEKIDLKNLGYLKIKRFQACDTLSRCS